MIDIDELLKTKKACLFDMDGTIIDSIGVWGQVDIDFLGRFGIDVPDDYEPALSGMSFLQVAEYTKERFNIPMTIPEIMDEWNRMAADKYEHEVPMKRGAYEFIELCKKKGLKLAVCTSNSRFLVTKTFHRLGIDLLMDLILTGDEITNGKPAPDIYLEAARLLDVNVDECLVFEDVIKGIEAGHNAGMEVCGVRDVYSLDVDEQKQMLSDYYTEDFNVFVYGLTR